MNAVGHACKTPAHNMKSRQARIGPLHIQDSFTFIQRNVKKIEPPSAETGARTSFDGARGRQGEFRDSRPVQLVHYVYYRLVTGHFIPAYHNRSVLHAFFSLF